MKTPSLEEWKERLRPYLLDLLNPKTPMADVTPEERTRVSHELDRAAGKNFKVEWYSALTPTQREALLSALLDEAFGFGLLDALLKDPSVSEIMVNGPASVFVERSGQIEATPLVFDSREQLMAVVEKLLAYTGRRVTESDPYVDARLADGSRINIALPAATLGGPYVTIRKFSRELLSLDRLVQFGSVSPQAAQFLQLCVQGRMNIVISGAASSGKTTMMNALAQLVPEAERIVLIEDTAELQLGKHHAVRFETRPPNVEGRGEITIRGLLRNALHMRPDRIFVGEVRGEEVLDMLQAMNTGHDGSMTTVHANSPADVLDRITTMALMARADLSSQAIERQVHSAVDLVIHQERFSDGTRKVTHISEVHSSTDRTPLVDLFLLTKHPREAVERLLPTGARPSFIERLAKRGLTIPDAVWALPA